MMNTKIKCLVTGGAGFIGSHLCDVLVAKGYDVFCVDNLVTGTKKNIIHLLDNPRFHFILHDVTEPVASAISYQLSAINYLYHLASPASPVQYRKYSIETLLVNSLGTFRMLELAKKTNASFLLASTSEVYGDPLKHPQNEDYFGNVNPVGIRACYDEGKRFAEAMTMEYIRKFNLNARIVRIFNTYGPRMKKDDGRVISNFINQAISGKPLVMYGDGMQTRSFCFISDMILGLVLAMEKEKTFGEVINLGYPKEHKIKEIAKVVIKLTKSSSKIKISDKQEDDPERRKPDISRAKQILGWQPRINLEEGIVRTISYFRNL